MRQQVPVSYQEIVESIFEFTGLGREEVEHNVWMECLDLGWNVRKDVQEFGVTPHVYNDAMDRLYRDGVGFIYETLVFWARPMRQEWTRHAIDRIRQYEKRTGRTKDDLRILMLGDGTGNDSITLASQGYHVDYFDVPGSKTFEFAIQQFERNGYLGEKIRLVEDYRSCLSHSYDVVWSFEVLEHLENPIQAIRDMRDMLKEGGVALVTEGFWHVGPSVPTHLKSNLRFAGTTPLLFLNKGLVLTWYAPNDSLRPSEYRKMADYSYVTRLSKLALDPRISRRYLSSRVRHFSRALRGLS